MRARTLWIACALPLVASLACESLTTPERRTVGYTLRVELNAESSALFSPEALTTGDTLHYKLTVSREDGSVVPQGQVSATWSVSDTDRLSVVDPIEGILFARRISGVNGDSVRVSVTVRDGGQRFTLTGRQEVRVQQEAFFGTLSQTEGVRWRQLLTIEAPPEQRFSPNTEVLFEPDADLSQAAAVPGLIFPEGRPDDGTLVVLVPAGLTRELASLWLTDINGTGGVMPTWIRLTRDPDDDDLDPREPNNTEEEAKDLTLPLGATVLSIHGDADQPPGAADVDFFKIAVASRATYTFRLVWNIPSNLDFEVYYYDLNLVKQQLLTANSLDTSTEQGEATLEPGRVHFLRIFPASFQGPTTYVLTIQPTS